MKKDIPIYTVENIAMAVVKEQGKNNEPEWNVYVLNLKDERIEGVLVTSKGYGGFDGEEIRTSTLRHFLDTIEAKGFAKVEMILENLFGISNEYWLSFYENKIMYDKKYIFLPETIKEDNFINIPLINKKGVMIK
jgi:hypothetical protein